MYSMYEYTPQNIDLTRYLLTQGLADINTRTFSDGTLIHHASCHGNLAAVKLLALAGVDPFAKNCKGRTAGESARLSLSFSHLQNKVDLKESVENCAAWLENEAANFVEERKNPEITKKVVSVQQSRTRPVQVMISYSWSTQKRVLQIKDALQKALPDNFRFWLDVEQMSGSTLAAMGKAVESADLVLIAMSSGYQNSENCRLECEYSCQQRKPIIPLALERGFHPSSWLGLICGSKLYFDFDANSVWQPQFDLQIPRLAKEIFSVSHLSESPKLNCLSCERWSQQKVVDWLHSVLPGQVAAEVAGLALDGPAILELARTHVTSPGSKFSRAIFPSEPAHALALGAALRKLLQESQLGMDC